MEEHEEAGVEFQHRETLDKKRGRVERRLYWSAAAPAALTANGDRTDLCSLGMVISERTENGKTTREVRYYSMSLENNVQEFSRVVRAHWSIEYLNLFPGLSTASASRDLRRAVDENRLQKTGDKAQTVHRFALG
jgi:predicted transposase YbfD/YdcC